jgi:membrane-associated phospholipid phosphatase
MKGAEIILWLQASRSPVLDILMLSLSALGSDYAYMVILPLIYWLVDRRRGWFLALVFLSSMELNAIIKEFTEIWRPFQVDPTVTLIGPEPDTYAFPSGHAQGSMMIFGGLTAMRSSLGRSILCGLTVFSIGLTRLYLGVHWPLDVAAGWAFGCLGLGVILALVKLSEMRPEIPKHWGTRLLWAAVGFGMIALHPSKETISPGATLAAVAVLEQWERKWIGFHDCDSISQRITRIAAGLIPPAALLASQHYFLPESLLMEGIVFGLLGGWMVLGAPYLFKRLRSCLS